MKGIGFFDFEIGFAMTPLLSESFLLSMFLKGSLLVGIVWLCLLAFRSGTAMTRNTVWMCTLIGLLLLPVFQYGLPSWGVLPAKEMDRAVRLPLSGWRGLSLDEGAAVPEAVALPEALDGTLSLMSDPEQSMEAATRPPTEFIVSSSVGWFARLWVIGVALLLLRMVLGLIGLANLVRSGTRVDQGRLFDELVEAKRALNCGHPVRLILRANGDLPMTTGLLTPSVVLPLGAEDWSDGQLRSVLRHEMAHVKRRDCWMLLVAQIACAVQWMNPMSWFALKRMVVEREQACDDWVVSSGISVKAYAASLLELGSQIKRGPLSPAVVGMASSGGLEARIRRVLSIRKPSPMTTWQGMTAVVLGVLAVSVALAALDRSQEEEGALDFSERISNAVFDSLKGEYPLKPSEQLEAIRLDWVAFLDEIVADDSVARARSKRLMVDIEKSIPHQLYRGGYSGFHVPPPIKGPFGRMFPDVEMEDDLMTLKWKVWRALTKPGLEADSEKELGRQKSMLQALIVVRDNLLKQLSPGGELFKVPVAKQSEALLHMYPSQSQREWVAIRERVTLDSSYADPLSAVFDRPLSAEQFDDLVSKIEESFGLALNTPGPVGPLRLPHVREIARWMREMRYGGAVRL
jgi:beta-lactamase regulating signal transducer with metallopeptidase domain